MNSNVLAIDNDSIFLSGLNILLEDADIGLEMINKGHEGIALVQADPEKYQVILLDYEMPGLKGDEVARRLKLLAPHLKIIMLSGTEDQEVVKSCYNAGAERFLLKGQEPQQILDTLKSVLNDELAEEIDVADDELTFSKNSALIEKILLMKGHSRALAKVASSVEKYAKSNESVLILGESGVGKEGVAKAIHANSSRADKPFIAINCGAIPRDLLESELFGHERGAFTGAFQNKKGKFLLANNGTLFLDEIGDLEPSLQVKILRALQEKTIEPVGGQMSIRVNIRIIAATHRNLSELVEKGLFREDLYYRLKVLPIQVPPLRERPEDIEPLVRHFLARQSTETGDCKKISEGALRMLKSLPWPGNIRQLEASIKYAFINSKRVVNVDSFDSELITKSRDNLKKLSQNTGLMTHLEFMTIVEEMEKSILKDALKLGGCKSVAANLLGMSHQAMNYRRKKLGLDEEFEQQTNMHLTKENQWEVV